MSVPRCPELVDWSRNREQTLYRSKAVGEPPLVLAISVFHALKDAISSLRGAGCRPLLHAPATPEQVLNGIEDLLQQQPKTANGKRRAAA